MFEVLFAVVSAIAVVSLIVGFDVVRMLKLFEARLDAVERGEFKDYGKGEDGDGE